MNLLTQTANSYTTHVSTNTYQVPNAPQSVVLEEVCTRVDQGPEVYRVSLKDLDPVRNGGHAMQPTFVRPEFYEIIKTQNPWADGSEARDAHVSPETYNSVPVAETQWDKDWSVILISGWNHHIMDANKVRLPYARSFDYCNSAFSNDHLRLDRAFINFLKDHPWVVNKDTLRIETMPYNDDEGSREFVHVVLYPDRETFLKVVEYHSSMRSNAYYSEADLLCGKAHAWDRSRPDFMGIGPYLI